MDGRGKLARATHAALHVVVGQDVNAQGFGFFFAPQVVQDEATVSVRIAAPMRGKCSGRCACALTKHAQCISLRDRMCYPSALLMEPLLEERLLR